MGTPVRYRVLDRIAHGGMAEIFLALQAGAEGFQKPVVLKRILPELASDPSFVRMLVDEAHIASTLNHSNLVQVLDLRKSGDEYFLVLEFVDGWSLEQVRRRALKAKYKLPLPLVLHIVGSLLRGLAYVHKHTRDGQPLGIVHRDVTPQNVLLSREGEVKLADFGIAKAVGKREKSAVGVIKGKFAYMSPEQAAGGELDARSDLFSVGTLLYLLTTGQKPFDGATDLDILVQVRKAEYAKPSTVTRDFNPEVEQLIVRALRLSLERRWQSADRMADRIDALIAKLGQPSGPAVLKRWLEGLAERDGAKPSPSLSAATALDSVVGLASRELDLQEISPGPATDADRGRPAEHTTRADAARAAKLAAVTRAAAPEESTRPRIVGRTSRGRVPTGLLEKAQATAATVKADAGADADVEGKAELPIGARLRQRRTALRNATLVAVAVGLLGGLGAYFAVSRLPPRFASPVKAWIHDRLAPPPEAATPRPAPADPTTGAP